MTAADQGSTDANVGNTTRPGSGLLGPSTLTVARKGDANSKQLAIKLQFWWQPKSPVRWAKVWRR